MSGRMVVWGAGMALAVGAVACGGGVSTQEFLDQADTACQGHRDTIEQAASQLLAGGQMPDPQQFGQLAMQTIIPETEQQVQDLRDLEAPAELADGFDAYLTATTQAVDQMRQDPSMLQDPTAFEDVNQKADAVGLSAACHVGSG